MRRGGIVLLGLGLLAASPVRAYGQATASPRRHSLEVAAGVAMMSGVDFGSRDANLTANDPGDPGFPLFHSATTLGAGAGVDTRLAFNLTRMLAVEGGFLWVRQNLETRIKGDFEGAPNTTLTQKLDTYFMEGGVVIHLSRMQFANGKGLPFFLAGAGYHRQLDERQLLKGSGPAFDAGGGVKYFLTRRPRGVLRDVGVRSDARVYVQSIDGDTDIGGKSTRVTWVLTASAVFRF